MLKLLPMSLAILFAGCFTQSKRTEPEAAAGYAVTRKVAPETDAEKAELLEIFSDDEEVKWQAFDQNDKDRSHSGTECFDRFYAFVDRVNSRDGVFFIGVKGTIRIVVRGDPRDGGEASRADLRMIAFWPVASNTYYSSAALRKYPIKSCDKRGEQFRFIEF